VPPSTLESRIRRLGIDKFAFRRRVYGNERTARHLSSSLSAPIDGERGA
jgi:hypothetical protein